MDHLWQPLSHVYRPLVFYLWSELMALISWAIMASWGFQKHSHMGLDYYTLHLPAPKPRSSSDYAHALSADDSHQGGHLSKEPKRQLISEGQIHSSVDFKDNVHTGGKDLLRKRRISVGAQRWSAGAADHPHHHGTAASVQSQLSAGIQDTDITRHDNCRSSAAAAPSAGAGRRTSEEPKGRPATHASRDEDWQHKLPIIFFHGVGMGLLPYLGFLSGLAATGERGAKERGCATDSLGALRCTFHIKLYLTVVKQ